MAFYKNVAGQKIPFFLKNATTGADINTGTPTVRVLKDGVSAAALGAAPVASGQHGEWTYTPTLAETNAEQLTISASIASGLTGFTTVYPQPGAVASGPLVDVGYWAGTVLPAPDTAGYPVVTIKGGTGTGELKINSGIADANVQQWADFAPNALISGRVDAHTGNVPSVNVTNWVGVPTLPLVNQFVQCIVADASQAGLAKWSNTDSGEITPVAGSIALLSRATTAGLTEQQVRDAMKLAPSVGAPAAGSVDTHLDEIQAQTDQLSFTGTGLEGNIKAINGDTTAAVRLAAHSRTATPVTFGANAVTTNAVFVNVDGSPASSVDGFYNSRILVVDSGSLRLQVAEITAYDGASKTATISATTAPINASHTAVLV